MRPRLLAVLPLLLLAAGCTSRSAPPSAARTPVLTPPATPAVAAGAATPEPGRSGCGQVYPAGSPLPAWTASAGPPTGLPWVLTNSSTMVGVLFGAPLRSGRRDDGKSNKILWISRAPRDGATLRITAGSGGMSVASSFPADSSPGEIYPSTVDVPSPGCWHLDLRWGSNSGSVDLYYGR